MKKLEQTLKQLLQKRKPNTNKGTFGNVLVVAGSLKLSGAAYLTIMGALRCGCGLVTAFVPKSIKSVVSTLIPEALVIPMPETDEGALDTQTFNYITNHIKKAEAIALGPGLGQDRPTEKLVEDMVTLIGYPMVIDADGLNIISKKIEMLHRKKADLILTPHPGEMARLTKSTVENIHQSREKVASNFAKKYNVTLVLKGHNTVVSDIEGNTWINQTGNSGMATGGTGDILTGMIAAFIAQKIGNFDSARLAVYLHGLAGDRAAKEKTQISLIPRDIIKHIPVAIKTVLGEN